MEVATVENNLERIPKCGAHSKNTGKPCQQPAMANGRCRLHGGKTPAGIASPHFKHGRQSKYPGLPISLAESYENARNDPELLNLSDEISLIHARLKQLILEKLDVEDSSKRWAMMREQFKLFNDARARRDGVGYGQAIAAIEQLIEDGQKDFMVWDDFLKTFAVYQKAISQEQKRRMDMHALISTDQAVGFVGEILLAVRQEIETLKVPREEAQRVLQAIHNKVREALQKRPQFAAGVKE